MQELIKIVGGIGLIAMSIVLLINKTSRTIIGQFIRHPFTKTDFDVVSDGNGSKDIIVKRNGSSKRISVS